MSVRGVWLLSIPGRDPGKLLFWRNFATVEKRSKLYDGTDYIPIPDATDFQDNLLLGLGVKYNTTGFVKSRDSCSLKDQTPVYEIQTSAGTLWPMLAVEQNGLLFCGLPLVEQGSASRPPLVQIPGVAMAFSLLQAMAEHLGPIPRKPEQMSTKFADLHMFVNHAAPFGTPIDVNPATINISVQGKLGPRPPPTQKQPAWKPISYKGKAQLHFTIQENIRAVQYDKPDVPDVWEVFGKVTCKADLEGVRPDVTITLGHVENLPATLLENIVLHSCVQSVEPHTQQADSHKLRFSPPAEVFTLCQYTAQCLPDLPIGGFYQMKGEKSVEVLVQLKLNENVRNNFDYCQVQLPFHNRGKILSHDSSASHGSVQVGADKILVWNIGQKFPTKTLEVLLKATVQFTKYEPVENGGLEEQFCVGQNAFAKLLFQISDFTHTGVHVDSKSIQISPATKFKLFSAREYKTTEYKIWNSHGDVLST